MDDVFIENHYKQMIASSKAEQNYQFVKRPYINKCEDCDFQGLDTDDIAYTLFCDECLGN